MLSRVASLADTQAANRTRLRAGSVLSLESADMVRAAE